MSLGQLLVVEDDEAIRRGVVDALTFAGYAVDEAPDGPQGLDAACSGRYDLVLLDILMPTMDGLEVLDQLRRVKPTLPVIFLTARGEEADKVAGLRLGADDYVVKPFGPAELMARVEAVLRRSAERPRTVQTLTIAGRTIDFERREVRHDDDQRTALSEREAEVLHYLATNRGRAVSRDELLARVWGIDPRGVQSRTVDMTIARLREHLRDDSASPSVIVTVRARGYMLAADEPADTPEGAPADEPAR